MKVLNGDRWKAGLLLSLIIPVSFLVASKLTGLTGGPATVAETITLEPLVWEFEKPLGMMEINESINSVYVDAGLTNVTVSINSYANGYLWIGVDLTTNLEEGHVENVNVTMLDDNPLSWVMINGIESGGNAPLAHWENLAAIDYNEGPRYGRGSVEKASVNLGGVNYPREVSLFLGSGWIEGGPDNQTQQLNVRVEVTYFNGILYKKVVQSFQIKLVAHNRINFETAEQIQLGERGKKHVLGGDGAEDFFKTYLEKGHRIEITMMPPGGADFDLYLYAPDNRDRPACSSVNRGNTTESIEYSTDMAGWWFVKIKDVVGGGIYILDVFQL